jgi:hypothetical protein
MASDPAKRSATRPTWWRRYRERRAFRRERRKGSIDPGAAAARGMGEGHGRRVDGGNSLSGGF